MAKKKVIESEITKELSDKATDTVLETINKKYGNVITTMAEVEDHIETISTGSISLDAALGRGGLAFGRIYEVYGPPMSGKSTFGVHVIIQAQRRGLRCAYFDAERAVDPKLFAKYGVDLAKCDIVKQHGGEANFDILEKLIRTGSYKVMVIDSVSALVPLAEIEAEMEKDSMALLARLMSKALRKITPQADEKGVLLIFVNQIRHKIGTYGNPETTSGGDALDFYCTGRIAMRGPESKVRRIIDPVTLDTIGHLSEYEITKNKLAPPFKKTKLQLIYGEGYNTYWEVLTLACDLGIIDKSGTWFKYEGEIIGQGETSAIEKLKSDFSMFTTIKNKLIEMMNIQETYVAHSNPGPLFANANISSIPSEKSSS